MGTKLHCESYLTGYYSMRNLNNDSSCSSWPFFNVDKNLTNGQCYNAFTPRIMSDGYPEYDKNTLRQKILEHETIFKNQVNELHRLYGIQKDMMQEIKRKELHKHWVSSVEPSSSSTRQGSQIPIDDAQKWHTMGFPLLNTSRVDIINSPSSCTKVYNTQASRSPLQNGCTSKDYERLDFRPSKVRKKLFDLQLPADEYIDTDDGLGRLADLNEPVVVDKGTTPSYTKCINLSVKPNAGFPFLNSFRDSKVNENGPLSRENAAGRTNGDPGLTTQSCLLKEAHHPSRKYLTGHIGEDIRRNGLDHGLESSCRNGLHPFVHSSGFPSSLSQPVLSWTKPTSSSQQDITIPSRTMWPSYPSREAFGDKWNVDSRLYSPLPSSGFDFLKCGRGDSVISEPPTNPRFEKFLMGPDVVDKSSSPSDKRPVFPWLGQKPVDKNKDTKHWKPESNDCGIRTKGEMSETQNSWKILGIPIFAPKDKPSPVVSTSATLDCPSEGKNVKSERKNILIDINLACEPEEEHMAAEGMTVEDKTPSKCTTINSRIDLNTCISEEDDPPSGVKIVLEIDLEAPAPPEVEDDVTPDDVTPSQPKENKAKGVEDDIINNAAKTIFAMSSLSKDSLPESILWFADVVSSFAKEKDDNAPIRDLPKEMDDFEATALQLTETKEEEYMPKPFIPEVQEEQATGPSSLTSRARRGQMRRGRHRKDFQRDVLPSLASLSRHEVTEDIQIFGGLMKATGQPWTSGLARRNGTRNGGARGRRLKIVETIETPVCTPLGDRSLTGWGKTTRRPRRQRCPAGNPPVMSLT